MEKSTETTLERGVAEGRSTTITYSRGFRDWLVNNNVCVAFTSYQSGELFIVSPRITGGVLFNKQNLTRAMGLYCADNEIYVATRSSIWRFANMLKPGQVGNGAFDNILVPRSSYVTGDIDVHEIALDGNEDIIFVNTKYSCLATISRKQSFTPVWKPTFISALCPEDRCHLNGVAMVGGEARYVSALSRSDMLNGWRSHRRAGGLVLDVQTDQIVVDGLSMPHSPRVWEDDLWVLESGRGFLVRVDRKTGRKEDVTFCPGFLRGLAFHNHFALVTTSKGREDRLDGLELSESLVSRAGEAQCSLLVVDMRSGGIVEWVYFDGFIDELFDVAVLPSKAAMALKIDSVEARDSISIDEFGALWAAPPV